MWDAIEVTTDVIFSIAAVVAAIYACVHISLVTDVRPFVAAAASTSEVDELQGSVSSAERLQRVAEYVIIAGYFQYLVVISVVAVVLYRTDNHVRLALILAVIGSALAVIAGIASLVVVSIGTERLNSNLPDLMRVSIRFSNSTTDLVVSNGTSDVTESSTQAVGLDWNQLQFELKCCGVNGPTDYANGSTVVPAWTRRSQDAAAPLACCRRTVGNSRYPGTSATYTASCLDDASSLTGYYSDGCLEVVQRSIKKSMTVTVVLACFVLALILASNIVRLARDCLDL